MAWAISLSMSWFRPSSWNSSHAQAHAEILADGLAHRLQHLHAEAQAVLQTAAVLVGAEVGARAPELVDQVLVGGGYLDAVHAGRLHAARRRREVGDDAADFLGLDGLGVALVHGSRTPDGLTRCGQCSPCQDERRPMWVAWIMMRAPWRCMASARRPSGSMTRSVERLTERHQPCGLSGETMLEPPQMASPRPPLAFPRSSAGSARRAGRVRRR